MLELDEFGIVLPVLFQIEDALPLVEEICARHMPGLKCIVLVIDESSVLNPELPDSLRGGDVEISVLALPLRVGQHRAIRIGLKQILVRKLGAVVMDSDGQDAAGAAEEIWRHSVLLDASVVGIRLGSSAGFWQKTSGKAFSSLLNLISDAPHDSRMSALSALPARDVCRVAAKFIGRRHYLHALILSGVQIHHFEYRRQPRYAGKSGYSSGRRIAHAMNGTVWWSTRPLWFSLALGLMGILISFVFLVLVFIAYLRSETPPGWVSSILPIVLGNSLVLTVLGTLGIYLERLIIQMDETSQ